VACCYRVRAWGWGATPPRLPRHDSGIIFCTGLAALAVASTVGGESGSLSRGTLFVPPRLLSFPPL
jgi:hypothetical protein